MEERAEPRSAPAREREDERVSANRCPFCHEDVDVLARDWLACRQCLGRHHVACWADARRCASCGCAEWLAQDVQVSRGARALVIGAAAGLALGLTAAALAVFRPDVLSGERPASSPPPARTPGARPAETVAPPVAVAGGRTLLVLDGGAYGAVVFLKETPAGATFRWYLRRGPGTLDPTRSGAPARRWRRRRTRRAGCTSP